MTPFRIIADNKNLAERVVDALRLNGQDCPVDGIVLAAPQEDVTADLTTFSGYVLIAAQSLADGHFDRIQSLRQRLDRDSKIVVVAAQEDHGAVLRAIRCGASDFMNFSAGLSTELAQFLSRAEAEKTQQVGRGQLLSVLPCDSPRDGNQLALNISAVLARHMGSCGLLDFHFRGGDLALMLKLEPRHSVVDLLDKRDCIDEAMLRKAATQHECGVELLAGPTDFIDMKGITMQACEQIVSLAIRCWPAVVVNLEDLQHEEQVRALAESDAIALTVRLDLASLHRAKRHVEFLARSGVSLERLHVVAMGAGYSGELPLSALKKVLQVNHVHSVPDDPIASIVATNIGVPMIIESPKSKASRSIIKIAEALAGSAAPKVHDHHSVLPLRAAAGLAMNAVPFFK